MYWWLGLPMWLPFSLIIQVFEKASWSILTSSLISMALLEGHLLYASNISFPVYIWWSDCVAIADTTSSGGSTHWQDSSDISFPIACSLMALLEGHLLCASNISFPVYIWWSDCIAIADTTSSGGSTHWQDSSDISFPIACSLMALLEGHLLCASNISFPVYIWWSDCIAIADTTSSGGSTHWQDSSDISFPIACSLMALLEGHLLCASNISFPVYIWWSDCIAIADTTSSVHTGKTYHCSNSLFCNGTCWRDICSVQATFLSQSIFDGQYCKKLSADTTLWRESDSSDISFPIACSLMALLEGHLLCASNISFPTQSNNMVRLYTL